MADLKVTSVPKPATYKILSGFIFNHCIYMRDGEATFSQKSAADLIERGLITAVKK